MVKCALEHGAGSGTMTMFDPGTWRKHSSTTVHHLRTGFTKLDRLCARMNDGLTALAVVLTIIVLATAVVRVPDLLAQRLDPSVAVPDLATPLPE